MIRSTVAMALIFLASLGAAAAAKNSFTLASRSFADGATIPVQYAASSDDCPGQNVSPELHWSGAPAGTKAFALTLFDPDAGAGRGFWHWVAYDIDPSTHELAEGAPSPGEGASNGTGEIGYHGPCPPPGDLPHHYVFTIYALDESIGSVDDGPSLLAAIKGHTLGSARFVGRFGR